MQKKALRATITSLLAFLFLLPGTVDKLKHMRLDPGNYDIRIEREGRELVSRNIHVFSGKTVKIDVNRG
jgi:hypothetical protein